MRKKICYSCKHSDWNSENGCDGGFCDGKECPSWEFAKSCETCAGSTSDCKGCDECNGFPHWSMNYSIEGLMLGKLGEACMLEKLAEEAAELAQAALKLARVLRGKNPTPVTEDQARENLREEANDVFLCLDELQIVKDYDAIAIKYKRFCERAGIVKEEDNENH